MSAGSNLQGAGGQTLEQRVANLEAALRGGPPVIDAQGAPTDRATDLGGPMNAWRNAYLERLILGGDEFPLLAMQRQIAAMRAEYDYVWNGVHPDDLDDDAVIWLDGTVTGDHDIAAMVDDDIVDFRLLLLTSGRDTSGDNRIVGTNAQGYLPGTSGGGAPGAEPNRTGVNSSTEIYGSWADVTTTARFSWNTGFQTSNNDLLTFPDGYWRSLTRGAGESMVVTLGEEGARGTTALPGSTLTKIAIAGTDIWRIARVTNVSTLANPAAGPINGACLLVPIYPL